MVVKNRRIKRLIRPARKTNVDENIITIMIIPITVKVS